MNKDKCAKEECQEDSLDGSHFCWAHADPDERVRERKRSSISKYLPLESPPKLPATFNTPSGPADEIEQLKYRITFLERELAGAEHRYRQLDQIYNKLADQWSVFQATTRPDNRNIQRAEGAGEMARKLAEVLLSAAYGTDARALLRDLLADMEGGVGRTVEVGGKLVKR